MADGWWELRELSETEREVAAQVASWFIDLGLDVDSAVVPDHGGEAVITYSAKTIGGDTEYIRPPRLDPDVNTWKRWIEEDYTPSFY